MPTNGKLTDKQIIARLKRERYALANALHQMIVSCEGMTGWGYDDDPDGMRDNQRHIKRWAAVLDKNFHESPV